MEAVESAWKLAKAYHAARELSRETQLVSRNLAYHGTSMGALTRRDTTPLRTPFEPLTRVACPWPHEASLAGRPRPALGADRRSREADPVRRPRRPVGRGDPRARANGGGCFVPPQEGYFQRVRESATATACF